MRALAETVCGGRLLFVLEGGYAASGLYEGTPALLDGLLERAAPALAKATRAGGRLALAQVIRQVAAVHRGRLRRPRRGLIRRRVLFRVGISCFVAQPIYKIWWDRRNISERLI